MSTIQRWFTILLSFLAVVILAISSILISAILRPIPTVSIAVQGSISLPGPTGNITITGLQLTLPANAISSSKPTINNLISR